MWAELSVSHFYNRKHWKRALNMIFNGSGCFQFPEVIVTSTLKESLRSTDLLIPVNYNFPLFYWSSNCGEQL